MSSSESEDDYANIANKLQKIKNQYREANKNTNTLDDSYELDQYLDNEESGAKNSTDSPPIESIAGPSLSNNTTANTGNSSKNTNKRLTRSSAKRKSGDDDDLPNVEIENSNAQEQAVPARRGRKRTTNIPSPARTAAPATRGRGRNRLHAWLQTNPSPRNRGRGRGRRNRSFVISRASLFEALNNMYSYPVHSIGDADEPYDHSRGQELFQKAPEPDVVTIDAENETDPLDDNEELSVKVYWQSCELVLFKIRKYQKITQIFNHFSEKKNVSKDNLLFMYNDKILKPDDTPDSINYSIANLIEGGIVNQKVSNLQENEEEQIKDGIKLKFQCAIIKKPFEMAVHPDDKFSVVMMKCSEHLEVPLSRLKFEFDGDVITSKNTARELELEGGECIDIKVIS